jgi:hypothetical protein
MSLRATLLAIATVVLLFVGSHAQADAVLPGAPAKTAKAGRGGEHSEIIISIVTKQGQGGGGNMIKFDASQSVHAMEALHWGDNIHIEISLAATGGKAGNSSPVCEGESIPFSTGIIGTVIMLDAAT